MADFRYSTAERCTWCAMRAVIPTEEVADRLVASAGNRLMKYQCPAGDGWHVSRPNVEHTSLLDNN